MSAFTSSVGQRSAARSGPTVWTTKGDGTGGTGGTRGTRWPTFFRAHRANDAAVLEAYGFPKDAAESDIVARLFKMYQDLTS